MGKGRLKGCVLFWAVVVPKLHQSLVQTYIAELLQYWSLSLCSIYCNSLVIKYFSVFDVPVQAHGRLTWSPGSSLNISK